MNEGRFELKYALPLERRQEVLAAAWDHVQPDPNGAEISALLPDDVLSSGPSPRGYRVCSLYLDTLDLQGYTERLAEARIRNRVRVRSYGLPGEVAPVFLESKRKLHRNVVKHRIRVGDTQAWSDGDSIRPWRDAVQNTGTEGVCPPMAGRGRRRGHAGRVPRDLCPGDLGPGPLQAHDRP